MRAGDEAGAAAPTGGSADPQRLAPLVAAFESVELAVVIQDSSGRISMANRAFCELVGSDDLVGRRTLELFREVHHDDGRLFAVDDMPGRVAMQTGRPRRNVMMRAEANGRRHLLHVSSYPYDLEGEPHVATLVTDMTRPSVVPSDWRDAEDRFRLLADAAPMGIFVAGPDGTPLYANKQAEVNTGLGTDEILTTQWQEFIHPDDLDAVAKEQQRAIDEHDDFVAEYRLVRPDGSTVWVRSRGGQIHDDDGTVIGVIGTITDITDIHEAQDRLREREERTRAIIESAAEGIVSIDDTGVITEFNAAAERIFGLDSADVIGVATFLDLLAPRTRAVMEEMWTTYEQGGSPRFVGGPAREVEGLHVSGRIVPIEVLVTEVTLQHGTMFTGVVRDLTQHRELTAELERLATHDGLTGLPNRLLLEAQLEVALGRATRHHTSIGVLTVQIDRVSVVAESLGHAAAEELISEAAARVVQVVDDAALVGRLAHDQFAVILDDLDGVDRFVATALAIIEDINRPFEIAGEEAFATANVGIVVGPGQDASTMVADAGVAMRRAAESSVTRYELFDPVMRSHVDEQRRKEIALRHGLEREEFELFYQPVVDLSAGRAIAAEALIRWHRPGHGLVLPDGFIPTAEDSGLIVELGQWVIESACAQIASWCSALGPACPQVSVNLSGRQLLDPALVDIVARAIEAHDADPARLAFEITETVLLADVERAVGVLETLRLLGVGIALDDFGTGYSSLTYLARFPVDAVKIDRSFVSGPAGVNIPIVTMIIGLADTLGLEVIAEGVETAEQAAALRALGCSRAQGFLYSPAVPVDSWSRATGR